MTAPTIIQFGTSRFLQAHVDLMLSEAAAGEAVGSVCIVETTGSPASQARVKAFRTQAAYPVRIRGLVNGRPVDVDRRVTAVTDGLSARADWERLRTLFVDHADYVISNTGDRGFDVPEKPDSTPAGWTTFPELLTSLLYERFRAGRPGLTIMPCELVERNGDRLRALVLTLAGAASPSADFRAWIETACIWANSLVDRIVSEPIEPIGAVAEPYALWAIERTDGLVPPCSHADIQLVDDLDFIEKRKLFLLNLGHTLMAERWRESGRAADETVRAMIADPTVRGWLDEIMIGEVVPAFGDRQAEASDYWRICLDRFGNPFLDHRLADIGQNHAAKIDRRAGGLVRWARRVRPDVGFPRLAAIFPGLGG
ncbi:mannitol dehydrogenase family protein [Kaistia dalseonensis]|uniref:Tagaturonate reductase n=1 Tax=Kaistia dalseonensis TaxID=410840 RepID=A0ABU0H4Y0_9HYPH|nr:mannitol dehydrogenase family protein [Kaistia dalseonensis]MCX5494759.1 mannitol dehydrogenase family protein [Kaistia dalseonensis]MDQ0437340.1 tagaturonate reductase [Kaistia dalseonensis]